MGKERELLERAHQFIWNKDGYDNELAEEIRAYLAEPTQDSVVADYATSEPVGGSKMELTTEPEAPFVRLTEEEVTEILTLAHTPYEAVCATENRLVEKNR